MMAGVLTDRYEIPAGQFEVHATIRGSGGIAIEKDLIVGIRDAVPQVTEV